MAGDRLLGSTQIASDNTPFVMCCSEDKEMQEREGGSRIGKWMDVSIK